MTEPVRHARARRRSVRGRRAVRAAGTWVFLALVVGAIAFLWPVSWGGDTAPTIVAGHSMEPTFRTGDLVVARAGEPHVGDVVIYRPVGYDAQIVHRIVGGNATDGWVMQGDNNAWQDPFRPTDDQIVGVVRLHVAHVRVLTRLLTSPAAWVAYALIVAGVLLWPGRVTTTVTEEIVPDEESPQQELQAAAQRL